ncbi:MAG: HAD family hydrolase [Lachnospiraceae bacterium]
MSRKIIFLDIDGTLTQPGSNDPPQSALWAIEKAREAGNYVFLCTGRNYGMLLPVLKYGFDGFIGSAGGYIVCGKQVIYDCPMTQEQAKKAMDLLAENGIFRTVECLEGSYTDEGLKEFLREHAAEGSNSEMLRWREQIEKSLHILPMRDYQGQPMYKIVMLCQSMEALREPEKRLGKDFAFCIQGQDRYGFINGELINRQFHKGKAVEKVCDYLKIPLSDSIAVGDSMNDREMLETAGISICMANGNEELKMLVDDLCPAVQEDGIREVFVKYHLV